MPKINRFPIGGVHLPEHKALTNKTAIVAMPAPNMVTIPLRQHLGQPCDPLVTVGDVVSKGQCIGSKDGALAARVHASISGTVTAIEDRTMVDGTQVRCIVIKRGDQSRETTFDVSTPISPEVIRQRVELAGIVGLGGACFPTHMKLKPPAEYPIETVVINGAECEPYLTVDHRLMVEKAKELMRGVQLIMLAVNANRGIVACEINKPDAIEVLQQEAENWSDIEVASLDTRYPHGAEKHLIKAVLDKEVPLRSLPFHIGVVVNNVQTAIKICEAVDLGRPLSSRVLTASGGALRKQQNLDVPLGTSIKDVVDFCGGATVDSYQTIIGGPMTGMDIDELDVPVTKSTSGIILLGPGEGNSGGQTERPCLRCGKCVDVCPMYLSPNRVAAYVAKGMIDKAEAEGLHDCIQCGACSFVCPAKRSLSSHVLQGKSEVEK